MAAPTISVVKLDIGETRFLGRLGKRNGKRSSAAWAKRQYSRLQRREAKRHQDYDDDGRPAFLVGESFWEEATFFAAKKEFNDIIYNLRGKILQLDEELKSQLATLLAK